MLQESMWQEIIVGIAVVGAILFLAMRYLPTGKKREGSCGECNGCGGCDKKP